MFVLVRSSLTFSRGRSIGAPTQRKCFCDKDFGLSRRCSPMPTQCSQAEMDFGSSGGRKLVGAFDGGAITSNGGVVLLAAADKPIGLSERLAACFRDHRNAALVTHETVDLLRQRIFGLGARLRGPDRPRRAALRSRADGGARQARGCARGQVDAQPAGACRKIGLDRHHKLDHDPTCHRAAVRRCVHGRA